MELNTWITQLIPHKSILMSCVLHIEVIYWTIKYPKYHLDSQLK